MLDKSRDRGVIILAGDQPWNGRSRNGMMTVSFPMLDFSQRRGAGALSGQERGSQSLIPS